MSVWRSPFTLRSTFNGLRWLPYSFPFVGSGAFFTGLGGSHDWESYFDFGLTRIEFSGFCQHFKYFSEFLLIQLLELTNGSLGKSALPAKHRCAEVFSTLFNSSKWVEQVGKCIFHRLALTCPPLPSVIDAYLKTEPFDGSYDRDSRTQESQFNQPVYKYPSTIPSFPISPPVHSL